MDTNSSPFPYCEWAVFSLWFFHNIITTWKWCVDGGRCWSLWKAKFPGTRTAKYLRGMLYPYSIRQWYVATCFLYSITAGLSSGVTIFSDEPYLIWRFTKFRRREIARPVLFSWSYKFVDYMFTKQSLLWHLALVYLLKWCPWWCVSRIYSADANHSPITIVTKRYLSVYLPEASSYSRSEKH